MFSNVVSSIVLACALVLLVSLLLARTLLKESGHVNEGV
jgi:hypothetical protein